MRLGGVRSFAPEPARQRARGGAARPVAFVLPRVGEQRGGDGCRRSTRPSRLPCGQWTAAWRSSRTNWAWTSVVAMFTAAGGPHRRCPACAAGAVRAGVRAGGAVVQLRRRGRRRCSATALASMWRHAGRRVVAGGCAAAGSAARRADRRPGAAGWPARRIGSGRSGDAAARRRCLDRRRDQPAGDDGRRRRCGA